MPEICKLEAAQRQLDCAIRLLLEKQDSLAVHTLTYAAYRLLRDLHDEKVRAVLDEFEAASGLKAIPNFLKHADTDADAILHDHSLETTRLTLALAIRLWKEHGQAETEAMSRFSALSDPYTRGYQVSAALGFAQSGPISDPDAAHADLQNIATLPSTGGMPITRKRKDTKP